MKKFSLADQEQKDAKPNWSESLIAFGADRILRPRSFSYGWLLSFPSSFWIFDGEKLTIIEVVFLRNSVLCIWYRKWCLQNVILIWICFAYYKCAIFRLLLFCFMLFVNRILEMQLSNSNKLSKPELVQWTSHNTAHEQGNTQTSILLNKTPIPDSVDSFVCSWAQKPGMSALWMRYVSTRASTISEYQSLGQCLSLKIRC